MAYSLEIEGLVSRIDELERENARLRRAREELLIYINGIANNSAKVVEAMRTATEQ